MLRLQSRSMICKPATTTTTTALLCSFGRFAASAAKTATTAAATSAPAASSSAAGRKGAIDGSNSATVQVADFCSLPASAIDRIPTVDKAWLAVDGAHRQRLEKFLDSAKKPFSATDALRIRTEGIKKLVDATELPTTAAIQPKLAGAIRAFIAAGKSDPTSLFQTYNDFSLLMKGLEREREVLQLDIWGYNDAIQLGLKFFSQEKLQQKRKALAQATKDLQANRKLNADTALAGFSTEVMNDMLNMLRISFLRGDKDARELGVQILDDLSLFGVPFNGETQLLFRNLVFGDLPHDDSGLLFELVECSVGGNVSVQAVPHAEKPGEWSKELDDVAEDTLNVISHRFKTPLSPELKKLRMVETHPMLQRSTE